MRQISVFTEDFSKFPLGPFPYDHEHSAMGEYHFYPEKGYKGKWFDPIADWDFKGPTWIVTNPHMNGQHAMEQQRLTYIQARKAIPTLRAGDDDWKNYQLSVKIRPLVKDAPSGVLFRYQTSMMHYAFFLTDNGAELQYVCKDKREILAKSEFIWSCDEFHILSVSVNESNINCFVDGEKVVSVTDDRWKCGAIALCSCVPAQYESFSVTMNEVDYSLFLQFKTDKKKIIQEKQDFFPKMKLLKKIDLKDFGAGRQIRFGHLTGTDELFFVIAQHQRRVYKDRYPFISCMTAVSFKTGKILWQIGEPNDSEDVIFLTTDLPFQVYDINGDGKDEVICSWDFKLFILEGSSGKILKSMDTPLNSEEPETVTGLEFGRYAFSRLNVDAIRIVNVTGKNRPCDILIKDRYSRLWLYDEELNLLWKFSKYNTGHFPFNYDFDGDGKDELFSCYNMVDDDGKLLWSLPINTDHTDEIIVGKLSTNQQPVIAIVSGWEGFMLVDFSGKILLKDVNGHGQRISVGSYNPSYSGLQICTTTYWGNNGIIYMHDSQGKELWHKEMQCNGNVISPINWDGSGQDLILLNPDVKYGGLMDGNGDVVVSFPDDGHPVLCGEVLDVTGDNREEIIVWDRKSLWIYTQNKKMPAKNRIYSPIKYPVYSASNYRGEYSFPCWKDNC